MPCIAKPGLHAGWQAAALSLHPHSGQAAVQYLDSSVTLPAGAPVTTNSTYVMCDPAGLWCYWHQGTDTRNSPQSRRYCQSLGGEGVW